MFLMLNQKRGGAKTSAAAEIIQAGLRILH